MFYLRISWLLIWTLLAHCTGEPPPETANEKRDRLLLEEIEANLKRLKATMSCEGCSLHETSWVGGDLRGANLRGAYLSQGDYRQADLRGADLRGARLGADFRGADFRGAKMENAWFGIFTKLQGARFDNLDLRTIRKADGTDWSGAVLRGVDFRGVWFYGSGGRVNKSELGHVFDVSNGGTWFVESDLRGANLNGAQFGDCIMHNADLRGAKMEQPVWGGKGGKSILLGDNWKGARLEGVLIDGKRICAEGSVGKCNPRKRVPLRATP